MHKKLEVWQLSMNLVQDIYKISKTYPKDEIYGLTNQMRRCAVSIPSNIAEGAARKGDKEFIQFLYIALGSAAELETQLLISQSLQYSFNQEYLHNLSRVKQMLYALIKYKEGRKKN